MLGNIIHTAVIVTSVAIDDGLLQGKFKAVHPNPATSNSKAEAEVTVNMDIAFVKANMKQFTQAFAVDVADAYHCLPEQVHVSSVTAGSVIVAFHIDGVEDADQLNS